MRDLRFVGVDDEGTRLLLVDEDGQQHQVQIDDALRTAVRTAGRPKSAEPVAVMENVRPRDVQSMLRSGLTIDEVADRTGWSPTKVGLFEPPIRAERDHVALTAQRLPLHTRVGGREQTSTVGERVGDRLAHRGVDPDDISWDAYRGDRGWTIECRFTAGGRARVATWRYDAATQSLHPTDDEARWLSEEEQAPTAAPFGRPAAPAAGVYDVVAEGGLEGTGPSQRATRPAAPPIPHAKVTETDEVEPEAPQSDDLHESTDDMDDAEASAEPEKHSSPVDLVSVMRERSKARRRSGGRRKTDSSPNHPAGKGQHPASAQPEPGAHDPEHETPAQDESENNGPEHADTEQTGSTRPADAGKPSVDELGHDPVTGTADLFGLKEVGPLRRDVVGEGSDRPAGPAPVAPLRPAPEPAADEATDTKDTPVEGSPTTSDAGADEAPANDSADAGTNATEKAAEDPGAHDDDDDTDAEKGEAFVPDRPSQARKGRPAVPSWDDIMFGKRGPKS